jgi:hypothetical protein
LARRLLAYGSMMTMNATLPAGQPMNTTTLNCPGFQALPKGVRQMLLFSEDYFFNEPTIDRPAVKMVAHRVNRGGKDFMGIPMLPARFNVGWAA